VGGCERGGSGKGSIEGVVVAVVVVGPVQRPERDDRVEALDELSPFSAPSGIRTRDLRIKKYTDYERENESK
jgi:hypothetical protein